MARIIWTHPALDDLDQIAEYIALDKAGPAKKLVQSVFKRVELLADSPKSGRIPPELPKGQVREVIVGPCRIFYRVVGQEVVILHVMRSERLLRLFMLDMRRGE